MRNFQRVNAMVEQAKAAKVRKQIRAISPNIWVNYNDLTATSLELIREIIPKWP
jgi:hypothetical protein